MIQLGIALLLVVAAIYLVNNFKRRQKLIEKEQELQEAELESDILDIDKSIAEERAHQRKMKKDINDLEGK